MRQRLLTPAFSSLPSVSFNVRQFVGSITDRKFFHSPEALGTIEACEPGLAFARRWLGRQPMHIELWNAGLLLADVVKVFNPQSPQARAIFDFAIVVIAVMVIIFAVVVGIAPAYCGTARQLLVTDSRPAVLGISVLTAAHQKNSNETATKGELNEMKSRIGTRDDSVAARCDQSAAGRQEGKARM
jgi:hypothetical protein